MEDRVELTISIERVRKWLGAAVAVALAVMEIVICVQYMPETNAVFTYIVLALCCVMLDALVVLNFYVFKPLKVKFVAYGVQFFFLLLISAITANDFCVVLYCLANTEFYMSNENLKLNFIIFGVSVGVFVASFVIGWVRVYDGESTYNAVVQILGGCLFGMLILMIHFFITYGLMRFYRTSKRLSAALAEADANKAAPQRRPEGSGSANRASATYSESL